MTNLDFPMFFALAFVCCYVLCIVLAGLAGLATDWTGGVDEHDQEGRERWIQTSVNGMYINFSVSHGTTKYLGCRMTLRNQMET